MRRWMLGAAMMAASTFAHADAISTPSRLGGWTFGLPDIGVNWEHEKKGDIELVNDETDKLPELTIAAFPASKEGTLAEVEGRLSQELANPNIEFNGEKVKSFKVEKAITETIADASVRLGSATVNGQKARFAIAQRNGHTFILVGVAKDGIAQRALGNFDAIVHKLLPADKKVGEKQPPPEAPEATSPPKLGAFVAVKEVTATSTYADKSKKDLYGAWRTISYETVDEGPDVGMFPKTAWCEGKPDEGIGEGVTITLATPTKLDTVSIAAGVWLTDKLFAANNQITELDVSFDGAAPVKVKPAAKRDWVDVKLTKPVSSITIKITAVKKGKMNDSCISGVVLGRGNDRVTALVGVDAAGAAALPGAIAALYKALEAPGHPSLDSLVEYPFSYNDSSAYLEGSAKPVMHANAKALAAACKNDGPKCPRTPYIKDSNRQFPAEINSAGNGIVELVFPSGREVRDLWLLKWTSGAWKLVRIDFRS